jgi:hypothetical protein
MVLYINCIFTGNDNKTVSKFFLNLERQFVGKKFSSNTKDINKSNAYFNNLEKSYYINNIKKIEYRFTIYTELKVDCLAV